MTQQNTNYKNASRPLLDKEQRESKYGWISRRYGSALSALAGNDNEVVDGFGTDPWPTEEKTDEYIPFQVEVPITVEDIIDIHDKMVDDFGGEFGLRDEGLLESIHDAPYTEFFGQEQYPEILDKAAKYLFDFTYYQVFIDGNKRTGLAVVNHYLSGNGLFLNMPVTKAYELVMSIANHGVKDSKDLVQILEQNLTTRPTNL